MTGKVFAIEEFSTFDGPGIRVTVFLKGCPLSCTWCHNPEGQSFSTEFVRSPNGCAKCGMCEKVASMENGRIVLNQQSMDECPRNLIRKSGIDYTPQELADKINAIADILVGAGGGVTFSGGEPLMQIDFIEKVCEKLDKRLSVAIQTSGYATSQVFSRALEICDYVLYDLKIMDNDLHQKFCGVPNDLIKENYATLARSKKQFVTRIPLIPTVTDTIENARQLALFMKTNSVYYAELLPYNKFASSKYALVLKEYQPGFDEKVEVCPRQEVFDEYGVKTVIM